MIVRGDELCESPFRLWISGRAALLRRRVCWPRNSAALPSGIGADYYRERV